MYIFDKGSGRRRGGGCGSKYLTLSLKYYLVLDEMLFMLNRNVTETSRLGFRKIINIYLKRMGAGYKYNKYIFKKNGSRVGK